jgi:MFS family permease
VVAIISSLGAQLIPSIARTDHVPLNSAQWALTVTLLAGAVATPTLGKLGDGPRRRRYLLAGLTCTFLGCIIAAIPGPLLQLICGRALQGIGLGTLPLSMAAAREHLPMRRATTAIAMLSVSSAAGVGIGYPLTGLVASRWGVHAAFWLGAVIVGVTLGMAIVAFPQSLSAFRHRLDIPGAVTVSLALLGLLLGLSQGARWGWTSPGVLVLIGGSLLLTAAWAWYELRATEPLVELRMLRRPAVLTADVAGLLIGIAMYLTLALITDYVQAPRSSGYGFSASVFVAGLIIVPMSVMSVVSSCVARPLARRFGIRRVLPIGALVLALGPIYFGLTGNSVWQAAVAMGVVGVGVGGTFAVMPILVVSAVDARHTSSALGLYQVLRYVGFSFGSALSATILLQGAHLGSPSETGYRIGLDLAAGICVLAAGVTAALSGSRDTETAATEPVLVAPARAAD